MSAVIHESLKRYLCGLFKWERTEPAKLSFTDQRVVEVSPSEHYPLSDLVVTACGHRQIRAAGAYRVGDMLPCPFCAADAGRFA